MKLFRFDAPILRQVAVPVSDFTPIPSFVEKMFEILDSSDGIGLAANQVGKPIRVIVLNVNGFRQEFINPEIIKRFGGKASPKEGCLSFPGVFIRKSRYKRVKVEGFSALGEPISRILSGLRAYCVQHEIDHLNGIVIGDSK